ncbi:MAG TPA: S41 family peptidase [bacterium]|nr:S41 family peptidase [bacterium]
MNPTRNRSLIALLLLALVAGAFLAGYGYGQGRVDAGADADSRGFALLRGLLHQVRTTYIKPDVQTDALFHGAARGMLEALGDPYSRFMDPGGYKGFRESLSGIFSGVGILIELSDGGPVVVQPIPDTPADRAGIRPGDRIVAVDRRKTDRMSLEEVVSRIRGAAGTKVTLTLRRSRRTFDQTLTRARIVNVTVRGERYLEEADRAALRAAGAAYLRIVSFDEPTARDFGRALDAALRAGARGLLLDLRTNGGGLLDVAVAIADRFVPAGDAIVHTVDRDGRRRTERASRSVKVQIPVVLLVNEFTASASEILTGALSDHEIARVVGVRTFGKGVIQRILSLPGGTGATLTSGRYLTPDGSDIHGKGIAPDVTAGGKLDGRSDKEIRKIEAAQFASALTVLKQQIAQRR